MAPTEHSMNIPQLQLSSDYLAPVVEQKFLKKNKNKHLLQNIYH